jgi:hypothetical protein
MTNVEGGNDPSFETGTPHMTVICDYSYTTRSGIPLDTISGGLVWPPLLLRSRPPTYYDYFFFFSGVPFCALFLLSPVSS